MAGPSVLLFFFLLMRENKVVTLSLLNVSLGHVTGPSCSLAVASGAIFTFSSSSPTNSSSSSQILMNLISNSA